MHMLPVCLLQVHVMRTELRDPDTVLAGFVPSIEGNRAQNSSQCSLVWQELLPRFCRHASTPIGVDLV